ncbi:MAG: hypothetical protein PF545_05355, partial [Elusimicrobia bacterium]|nr:hypothetical protein [Elusimicrobiota bacterium]
MFSKITVIWSAWIISSAFFMRQVLNFIKSNLSSVGFKTSISVLFALLSVTAFVYILRVGRNRLKVPRIVLILVVFIAGVIYALGMGIPEEQMHLINFGVLGWLGVMDSEKLS